VIGVARPSTACVVVEVAMYSALVYRHTDASIISMKLG
jgi:hypothetical protein